MNYHDILQSTEPDEGLYSSHDSLRDGVSGANYDSTSPRSGQLDSHSPEIVGEKPALQNGSSIPIRSPVATANSKAYTLGSAMMSKLSRLPQNMAIVPPQRPKFNPLPYATGRSGLVYDVQMRYHREPLSDDLDSHPERADRITYIYEELKAAGLISDLEDEIEDQSEFQLVRISPRHAFPNEIRLVHSEQLVEFVQSSKDMGVDQLEALSIAGEADSIYWHQTTYFCAALSAGCAIQATKAVVAGLVRNAVAVIRPPGHHAEHDKPSGFCFFNNVPVAVKAAQGDFPNACRKVLVLDWDVHHGNGTQQAFYQDPNVLYVSVHVHMNGSFYPHSDYGDHVHCGEGPGLGRNVNIPWSYNQMTDADYLMAFQQVVLPICTEFDPDLVMISAGFDAADGDPLGNCYVSPACFAHMTHMLMQLAKGKVVACLEGGYNLVSTAKSFAAMTRTLMGEPPERIGENLVPTPSAIDDLKMVVRTQSQFWKCMYPKNIDIQRKKEMGSERLHDVIREWQAGTLFKEYNMINLFIYRDEISRSFENQVLATGNFDEQRPLLVIFHDPPEAMGLAHPRTNELELHNTWITDVSKTYVDWGVKQQFAVIDVNIPKHITDKDDELSYVEADSEKKRRNATAELAKYIFQNYIEPSDCTHVFFIGIGDCYIGIVDLLRDVYSALNKIDLVVSFVAQNDLRAVDDPDDETVAKKYYKKSMIFVSPEHPAAQPDRKMKRRHGRLTVSGKNTLQDMMAAHKDQVTARLEELTREWREEQGPLEAPEPIKNVSRGRDDGDAGEGISRARGRSAAQVHGEGTSGVAMDVDEPFETQR